jgi:hypothetical protein
MASFHGPSLTEMHHLFNDDGYLVAFVHSCLHMPVWCTLACTCSSAFNLQEPDRALGDWAIKWLEQHTRFVKEHIGGFVVDEEDGRVSKRLPVLLSCCIRHTYDRSRQKHVDSSHSWPREYFRHQVCDH